MENLPIFPSDYLRGVSKAPLLAMLNRFAEKNPALTDTEASFIARPGLRKFTTVGNGPIRALYSSAGAFDSDLFAVSNTELYRIDSDDGSDTLIGVIGASGNVGDVSMAATAPIGTEVPSYLFIAEGGVLLYYTDNGFAIATLTASANPANGNVVRLDNVYYQFTSGSVDSGTPAGTVGSPWLVAIGGSTVASLQNLFNAVNRNGGAGTIYSTALTEHPTVEALNYTPTVIAFKAKVAGTAGNTYASTETGANLSFSGATFSGGGSAQLNQITLPEDVGAISVAYINSYVIVVPVQDAALGTLGTFYWIEPGEVIIDPLNFANAERSPDRINQVITFGDMFWLFGDTTTEPWVTTGNQASPMQRFQGILFDRGTWEGTAIKVRDNMITTDEQGGVFLLNNGQRRISNPAIEEKIRKAIGSQSI